MGPLIKYYNNFPVSISSNPEAFFHEYENNREIMPWF
jgi:hypothetical protein